MAGERRALLVATDTYDDPGLTQLRAPTGDVRALTEVLGDPEIGGFEVDQLLNRPTDELKQEIEGFFGDAHLQDLLLLYVTGHGVLSQGRRLFLATATTRLKRLRATAIDEDFLRGVMQDSRARSIVLVLDCCHSGAFAAGLTPKSAAAVDVSTRFEGQGQVTLTASNALEYAFEDDGGDPDDLGAEAPGSLFTRFFVEGLRTGDADVDADGRVSVDELYDYMHRRVSERTRHQTPGRSATGHGDITIALNPHRPALPNEVSGAIEQALTHPWTAIREAAIGELVRLRDDADTALTGAIDDALRRAVRDESRQVSEAAKVALGLSSPAPPPTKPAAAPRARSKPKPPAPAPPPAPTVIFECPAVKRFTLWSHTDCKVTLTSEGLSFQDNEKAEYSYRLTTEQLGRSSCRGKRKDDLLFTLPDGETYELGLNSRMDREHLAAALRTLTGGGIRFLP